ncbi:SH3 domain-containing protein [Leucothrix arctica]|uniref:SH3b domain-containing protein n=1 Tax=Leucothrix arctica TaxID=1481894 RepID=A0A317C4C1_9GAMM|nr:SH3 domain-containing protein [Leucothrix arctica]PWQ93454.1 hypothetical protein DKT75_17670 [Leucothrix arctica]
MDVLSRLKQVASISTVVLCISAGAFTQATAAERYIVSGVESWDTLNIRSQPNHRSTIIGEIPANGSSINSTGEESGSGRSTWTKVSFNGVSGWVSKRYLATDYSFVAPTPAAPAVPAYRPQPAYTPQVSVSVARTGSIYDSGAGTTTSAVRSVYVGPGNGLPAITRKQQPTRVAPVQQRRTPVSVSHTHPANECTRSSTHSHPGGGNTHQHRYSCQGKATQQARPQVQVRAASNANSHTHPSNQFTNAVTHTHASGNANHNHNYGGQQRTVQQPTQQRVQVRAAATGTAHTHPRNQFSNAVTHTHASNNPQHAHNYAGNRTQQQQARTVTPTANQPVTHIHPQTAYNKKTTHTHVGGAGVHLHDFLLPKTNQVRQQQVSNNDANLHRHQANQFTRSTAHTHANGRVAHNHSYSGQR